MLQKNSILLRKTIKILLIMFIIISIYILFANTETYATAQMTSTDIAEIDERAYPGFKKLIQDLQKKHPTWKFTVLYTDLDWNEVIAKEYSGHESSPKNLIQKANNYKGDWICSICGDSTFDNGTWLCASYSAIEYMMDPRNSINDTDIFQFQNLSSAEANKESIQKLVKDTFIDEEECIDALLTAATTYNVSPYHLVSRILQEQTRSGSVLSLGQGYKGKYEGYYNLFNIGAYGNGKDTIIFNGLSRAEKEGWTSKAEAIKGGAKFLASYYINKGQNTLYTQKFNVTNFSSGLYSNQYMQNIMAAQVEGTTMRSEYISAEILENEFEFIIPLYKNMPTEKCERPATVTTVIEGEKVKINVNGELALRSTPTGGTVLAWIKAGTEVIRLEKATETGHNGYYWDKIAIEGGVEGYMARGEKDGSKLWLVPVEIEIEKPDENDKPNEGNNNNTDKPEVGEETTNDGATAKPEPSIIETKNGKYKIEESSIILEPDVSLENIKEKYDKATSDNKTLGTGSKVTINDKEYTVIKIGDVNGDGNITPLDYVKIKNNIMKTSILEGYFKLAGDTNKDGNITPLDYVKVKNNIMNVSKISL